MPSRKQAPSRHKPKLGQNFLVSPTAPRAIVDALGDLAQATVLEIGAGKGVLTTLLAALQREWTGSEKQVEIICQDILTVALTRLATEPGVRLQVIGNLPYY